MDTIAAPIPNDPAPINPNQGIPNLEAFAKKIAMEVRKQNMTGVNLNDEEAQRILKHFFTCRVNTKQARRQSLECLAQFLRSGGSIRTVQTLFRYD